MALRQHPLALYRTWLVERGILGSRELERCPIGRQVKAAGLVVVHQSPPTAKGVHFVTLEDENGFISVIVRPDIYARYRNVLRDAPLLVVEGEVQRRGSVINLVADKVAALGS